MLNVAFGSTALCFATLVFLFIARIRFPASDSPIGVLRKRYGRDLVKKVKKLDKINFLKRQFWIKIIYVSCRKIVFSRNIYS